MAKRKAAAAKSRTSAATRSGGGRSRKAATKRGASAARKQSKGARKAAKATVRKRSAARGGAKKAAARRATSRPVGTRKTASRRPAARKAIGRKAQARSVARPAARPRPVTSAKTASTARRIPALNRARRTVQGEDIVQTPPSSLNLNRNASATRTGRREMHEREEQLTQTGPALTGGDVDADWESAYSTGDEAPGGDNPTPDQDIVDDIGRAIGNEYADNEELKGDSKIAKRDKNRWELDPASSEDYNDR